MEDSLNLRDRNLHFLKCMFYAKNVIHRLPRSISSHFGNSLLKCVSQAEIAKKNSLETPILGVQGHSKSSTMTPMKSLSLLLVMMSSMSVPICNHFHATQANSSKITTF